jgi:uncharacterized protein
MPDSGPIVVLDTNVVLDWLVFGDVTCAALADAITRARVRWLASAPMHAEFERVLHRGDLSGRRPPVDAVLEVWQRCALRVDPAPASTDPTWRCTDPDDQMFIDLAVHRRASALLTRDRALLRLARRAGAIGLAISLPGHWRPPAPG